MQGILNVNKPRDVTSFSIVSLVRRLSGVRRVGHAGTLDPIADGVLPVCIGRATRIVEYLVGAPKTYRVAIHLGAATDTYDSEGQVVATGDPAGVTPRDIEDALRAFEGEIQQLPPMYSALKHEGRPLYAYARAGKTAPRRERTVTVYALRLLDYTRPIVDVEFEVGRGAYVRTLAHNLGERLGCYGHVERLTRLRSGPFAIDDAVSPETLERAAASSQLESLLHPVDRVLESWDAALLAEAHATDVTRGRLLVLDRLEGASEPPPDAPCRAYSEQGEFLAVLRYRGANRWHPEKVFVAR